MNLGMYLHWNDTGTPSKKETLLIRGPKGGPIRIQYEQGFRRRCFELRETFTPGFQVKPFEQLARKSHRRRRGERLIAANTIKFESLVREGQDPQKVAEQIAAGARIVEVMG